MTDPEVPPPRRFAPWPGTLQLLRAIRDADAKALLAREAGVLQAIIQRQGKNGSPCVATMATLGADAKVDRRTVIRAIAGLKKRGLLHVQRQRKGTTTQACTASRYAANVANVLALKPRRSSRFVGTPVPGEDALPEPTPAAARPAKPKPAATPAAAKPALARPIPRPLAPPTSAPAPTSSPRPRPVPPPRRPPPLPPPPTPEEREAGLRHARNLIEVLEAIKKKQNPTPAPAPYVFRSDPDGYDFEDIDRGDDYPADDVAT